MLNPTRLSWQAPTENEDGTAIDYSLGYHLYADGTPIVSFPGSLSTDGSFEVLFEEMGFEFEDGTFSLTMTAFDEANPERESAHTNPVSVSFFVLPLPPRNLAVGA